MQSKSRIISIFYLVAHIVFNSNCGLKIKGSEKQLRQSGNRSINVYNLFFASAVLAVKENGSIDHGDFMVIKT